MSGPLYIGCDDSGFDMKMRVIGELHSMNIDYFDCGSGEEASRYPYYAARVASAVSRGIAEKGILICGSGIGMSIAANKFPNVRASMVSDTYSARLTRSHNDSNILCIGGRTTGIWTALEIVRVWLSTPYDGGHHDDSLKLIEQMEDLMMTGNIWCPDEIPYEKFSWDPNQRL